MNIYRLWILLAVALLVTGAAIVVTPTSILLLVAFVVSIILYVLFFAWVAEQMDHPVKAALTVAVSQLLLVDVDYVLSGKRGIEEAGASALLLLVSWTITGLVYDQLTKRATFANASGSG